MQVVAKERRTKLYWKVVNFSVLLPGYMDKMLGPGTLSLHRFRPIRGKLESSFTLVGWVWADEDDPEWVGEEEDGNKWTHRFQEGKCMNVYNI